jgi:acetyl-CoA C-acetyltransferase
VTVDPRAACIIGVARRTWHEEPAPEPLDMWESLARAAADDAGCPSAVGELDSIQVVYCQSWEYDDPCGRLAERLGAAPSVARYSGLGGSVPVRLLGETAAAMASGELDLALIVGGEALATRRHLPDPAWSHPPEEPQPFPLSIDKDEARHGIYQAYLTFALLDTARRIHLGLSPADHRQELGRLMAALTDVAASQPTHAWFPTARSAEDIITPSPSNRMVSSPYTKLMTAIMDVDMAAAVLVATEAEADALGVAADQRVYLRGAAAAEDPATMATRPEPWRSPAMAQAMTQAMAQATGGLSVYEVAHLDLYSCFGSSLSFARDALDLGPGDDRPLTVTGGLPYHGGPGSNYSTHALAAMTEVLRQDPDSLGLVTGVGMHMTSHSAALLSTRPGPPGPTAATAATAAIAATATTGPSATHPSPTVPLAHPADGTARVIAYSTVYSREGPEWTALIAELADGSRTYARLDEPAGAEEDLADSPVAVTTGERKIVTAHR